MLDQRLGMLDRILLGGSLVGAIAVGYFLLNDKLLDELLFNTKKSNSSKIGEVVTAKNDVRRRNGQSLLWYKVNSQDQLFENDSIFSGPDSELEVDLGKDVKLTLGPNSMVIVQKTANEMKLDLQLGTVVANVRQGKKIRLLQEGQEAEVSSGNSQSVVNLSRNTEGQLQVASMQGQAKLKINNQENSLGKEEVLSIDKSLKTNVKKLDVVLISPFRNEKLWVDKDKGVSFYWKINNPAQPYRLQVSSDQEFKKLIIDQDVAGQTYFVTKKIKDEKLYYWRISGNTNSNVESTSNFTLLNKNAPQPIFPTQQLRLSDSRINKKNPKMPVRFEWTDSIGVSQYTLEVAQDSSFTKGVERMKTNNAFVSNLKLTSGEYFWRVQASDKSPIKGIWSPVVQFFIGKDAESSENNLALTPPTPPTIEIKPEVEKVPVLDDSLNPPITVVKSDTVLLKYKKNTKGRDPASLRENLINPPQFTWESGAQKLDSYVFEFSSDTEFSSLLFKETVSSTNFSWNIAEPGTYFWRVKGQTSDKRETPYSAAQKINVKLSPPLFADNYFYRNEVDDPSRLKSERKFQVKWNILPYAEGYRVIASESASDNSVKPLWRKDVSSNQLETVAEPNKPYFLKVAAIDQQGKELGPYSPTTKVDFSQKIRLPLPQAVLPNNGTTIVSFGSSAEPILFTWKPVKNVKKYRMQFSKDKGFSKIDKEVEMTESQFVTKPNFGKGITYWRLQAVKDEYTSDWTQAKYFELQ